jgi:hypothetical protein
VAIRDQTGDRLWEIGDIVALVEANDPKLGKRGPCKKIADEIPNSPTTQYSHRRLGGILPPITIVMWGCMWGQNT